MGKWMSLVVLVVVVVFSGLAYGQPNDQPARHANLQGDAGGPNLAAGSIGGPVQAGQGGQSPEATEQPKTTVQAPPSANQIAPTSVHVGQAQVDIRADRINIYGTARSSRGRGHRVIHRRSISTRGLSAGQVKSLLRTELAGYASKNDIKCLETQLGSLFKLWASRNPASPGKAVNPPPSGDQPKKPAEKEPEKEKGMDPTLFIAGLVTLVVLGGLGIGYYTAANARHIRERELAIEQTTAANRTQTVARLPQNIPPGAVVRWSSSDWVGGGNSSCEINTQPPQPTTQIQAIAPPVAALVVTPAPGAPAVNIVTFGGGAAPQPQPGQLVAPPPAPPAPQPAPAAQPTAAAPVRINPNAPAAGAAA